ncbi:MAG: YheT family hydrolase [Bryobacteraceae bacterium]
MPPFIPLFRNPHLQTILAYYWKRPDSEARCPTIRRLFRTEPAVEVLVESQRPAGPARGEMVMVHGLEGSSQAVYMRSLAGAALAAGFAAHRFNLRTCGGTEHLCRTLYHAGLTSDLLSVLRQLQAEGAERHAPAILVGFSLGGNVVLKLAGELGEAAPPLIQAVCAVSTPLDLAACARRMEQPANQLYEDRFVARMKARLEATGRYRAQDLRGLHSVMQIDDRITASSFGFGNAENYYRTQSARHYLAALRVPALLIQAKDDPMVPFESFEAPEVRENSRICLLAPDHGGHLGFLARRPARFWVDAAVMAWVEGLS